MQLPEQAEFLAQCVGASWADMHEKRAWDEQVLLEEARSVFPNTQLAKETLCISV